MTSTQPIACDFTAIEKEEREIHKQNSEEVFESVVDWQEVADGYTFQLPTQTDIIEKAGAFIARERLCCPFFTFNLEVTPNRGPVWLTMTGNEEVKSYIKQNVIAQIQNKGADDNWELPGDRDE